MTQNLILCIRGMLSPKDILTDLCCVGEDFYNIDDDNMDDNNGVEVVFGSAHQGMIHAAWSVANMTQDINTNELKANPNFNLVIVSHSLGGVKSVFFFTRMSKYFDNRIHCFRYSCMFSINIEKQYISK